MLADWNDTCEFIVMTAYVILLVSEWKIKQRANQKVNVQDRQKDNVSGGIHYKPATEGVFSVCVIRSSTYEEFPAGTVATCLTPVKHFSFSLMSESFGPFGSTPRNRGNKITELTLIVQWILLMPWYSVLKTKAAFTTCLHFTFLCLWIYYWL